MSGDGRYQTPDPTCSVLNAQSFHPCEDCGALMFLGNPSVIHVTERDVSTGAVRFLKCYCARCGNENPEVKAKLETAKRRIVPIVAVPRGTGGLQ